MIITGKKLEEFIFENISGKTEREYVTKIYETFLSSKLFNLLVGLRRIGKSTICFQIISRLVNNKVFEWEKIAYIDIENIKARGFSSKEIIQQLDNIIDSKEIKFLFVDEVQLIDNWDMYLKSVHDHYKHIKILCTGSSSYRLNSRESGIGRFKQINILPLTLKEFVQLPQFNHLINELSKQKIIDYYLQKTPFFEIWEEHNVYRKEQFIIELMNQTLEQETNLISLRNYSKTEIRLILKNIALSVTGELSVNKLLADYNMPKSSFYHYLDIMNKMMIIDTLPKKNSNLVTIKTGAQKYYLSNPFTYQIFINKNDLNYPFHMGKVYESLLLFHLRYFGYKDIFYVKDAVYEIDFYIQDIGKIIELKNNHVQHNKLFYEIKSDQIKFKEIMSIESLFDYLMSVELTI